MGDAPAEKVGRKVVYHKILLCVDDSEHSGRHRGRVRLTMPGHTADREREVEVETKPANFADSHTA